MSQPSPTPHTTWRSLLQSSPRESQPFPGGRKRLQRASSAESITLSGLSGWRRQPKQQKRTSPISYAQSTNTVPNVGKGEERTSLGMGMTGTPAKRRTLSRKAAT
ncbi:hypothetical protein B9479_000546 [Cryptococcus floricola]|uniref:Uncharacterized protein n=1 Tax=Cryptococcus floricola TaxID=2591691 RepID=A0A5D3B8Z2_9TREE|nr:hypothetical protein B9479_000546 [Cryptococcus floricola]